MPPTVETIMEQARQLDDEQLAALRDALESEEHLRQIDPAELDRIGQIAEQRMREVDEGRSEMLDGETVMRQLKERISSR